MSKKIGPQRGSNLSDQEVHLIVVVVDLVNMVTLLGHSHMEPP